MQKYHDTEWGVPTRDSRKLFEFLILESAQAGLSWKTILYKREGYRKAFANFDPKKVAQFGKREVVRLLKDSRIVRNRLKIEGAINNAKRFLEVEQEFGSFANYCDQFVERSLKHRPKTLKDYLVTTPEAEALAKDMKKRGFKFLGPTTLYAHMQAVGLVDDHMQGCFKA